jgi:hypothetical protein
MILQLWIFLNLLPYRALIATCYSVLLLLANKIIITLWKSKKSKM